MNNGGEAADQVVNMSLKGLEVVVRLSGAGAKNLATYLYAILTSKKRTKGKARLETMLRSGKALNVFAVKNEDLATFTKEAKRYGVLYCALKDKKNIDGMCDVIVRAEDAPKINRIIDRFHLATVDTASIKSEIQQDKAKKETAPEKTNDIFHALMGEENDLEKVPKSMVTEIKNPSETFSKDNEKINTSINETPIRKRRSVKEELQEIKQQQKLPKEKEPTKEKEQQPKRRSVDNANYQKHNSKKKKSRRRGR